MPTARSSSLFTALTPQRVASALAVLLGIGLASYGGYTYYSISRALGRGACDGCSALHPLLVLAPLLGGIALVAVGSYAFARTTC